MNVGSLGVMTSDMLDPNSPFYIGKKQLYLTEATDCTKHYKGVWIGYRDRSVYEVSYKSLTSKTPFYCTALLMENVVVPDDVVFEEATGRHYRLVPNVHQIKYYQVLLNFNGTLKITYLHEKAIQCFDWSKGDRDFHTGAPLPEPALPPNMCHLWVLRSNS